jgi:uncharacterized integral membrane protein
MSQPKEESFIVKYRKEIIIAVIALLMLLFIVFNSEKIDFSLVFFSISISKIFLIALFFALGMLTIWVRNYSLNKEKNNRIKDLEAKVKELEKGNQPPLPPLPPVQS